MDKVKNNTATNKNLKRVGVKEANYILQLSSDDLQFLSEHKDLLSQGSANFAVQYYNFLFDNPAMAEILYSYELQGGDISELVRNHLAQFLHLLEGTADADYANIGYNIGVKHAHLAIKPLWVMGGYRLYLEHLQELVGSSVEVDADQKIRLLNVVSKQIFREMGFVLQGYWETLLDGNVNAKPDVERQDTEKDLLDHLPMMFWSVDVLNNKLLYSAKEFDGDIPYLEQVHQDDRDKIFQAWHQAMQGDSVQIECRLKQKSNKEGVWHRFLMYPVHDVTGKVKRIDGFLEDIHDSKLERDDILNEAYGDEITGLINRSVWMDRLDQALASAQRSGEKQTVLMLLNLDSFDRVNEALGRAVGDELLRQVALRIDQVLRGTDSVARIANNKFGVILPSVNSAEAAGDIVAAKIIACFEKSFKCDTEMLYMTADLGISIYPDHANNSEDLYKCAELAMKAAKKSESHYTFYQLMDAIGDSSGLSEQLRLALSRREFELHYQPKVDMSGGRLNGIEALLRWNHPNDGLIQPNGFIQTAEKMGLMVPITDWVISTALKQSKIWKEEGVIDVPVAVNISARTFQTPRLLNRIIKLLKNAGVDGDRLELDITEDTLMLDTRNSLGMLSKLRDLGVTIAIDDYGTGSSSLSYLQSLPIDHIKIDGSFLQPINGKPQQSVVNSIIDVGHNMGCQVIAEGVENNETWDMLMAMGCDSAQGYHISRPLETQHLSSWQDTQEQV